MTASRRPLPLLLVLALLLGVLGLVVAPPGGPPPAAAATRVDKDDCRRIDPNLVNGACLRYRTPRGSGLTWIGSYRAPDGRVFFCIDFLYDSRLPRRAARVPTDDLVNQLGRRVGDAEVAALNHLVSRWAGDGSTGSDDRDAAIALVIREVMGDGVAPGGVVVYPRGLEVGERVRPPVGGLDGRVLTLARAMWREASAYRGPYTMTLTPRRKQPVRLGQVRGFRLSVYSGAGRRVPDVRVRLTCRGPVRCRRAVLTSRRPTIVRLRPTDTGRVRLVARASGPSSDGVLYRQRGWRTHGGRTARPVGVQRGWIAQENVVRAAVALEARVRRARPDLVTVTSDAEVTPGAEIHDVVTVSGLPPGYDRMLTASLYGPYDEQPGTGDCAPDELAGRVRFAVEGDGTYETPAVRVGAVGYYTWVQHVPRDVDTAAVTTSCGVVAETTHSVPRTPRVTTVASTQQARVGRRIHDTVQVAGLAPDDHVVVRWRLHGPVAPRRGSSCRDLDWRGAPVADSGSFAVVGSGRYRTPSTRLRSPGCFTYSESLAATPTTEAAATEPGLPLETSFVARTPPPWVPEVPSGAGPPRSGPLASLTLVPTADPSDFEPAARVRPRYLERDYVAPERALRGIGRLAVPRVGVRVGIAAVGLDRGAMAVPNSRHRVGWLRSTAAVDDLLGASVLAGHVSGERGGLGRLSEVRRGDVVRWTIRTGETRRFEVTRVRRVPRTAGLPTELFRTDGPHRLHLVTCTTRRRTPGGDGYFADNLVVTAVALS